MFLAIPRGIDRAGRLIGRQTVAAWDAVTTRLALWRKSRRFRRLLYGSPALMVALGVMVIVGIQWLRPTSAIGNYQLAINDAIDREDYEAAEVYLRKLATFEGMQDRAKFHLARIAQAMGKEEEAARIIAELAPEDGAGYPEAHFLVAEKLARDNAQWTQEKLDTVIYHLEAVLKTAPHHARSHRMLGEAYLARRDLDQAATHFAAAADSHPQVRLVLARIYQRRDKDHLAQIEIEKAINHFGDKAKADRTDVDSRLNWAQALLMKNRSPQEVAKILQEGLDRVGDQRYKEALASLYCAQSDQIAKSAPQQVGPRLVLLEAALELSPNNINVLNRLARIAGHQGEEGKIAREHLEKVLTAGTATATIHLIYGTDALQRGDFELGRMHLEQAFRQNPRMPAVANNLAWLWANSETPDLDQALKLASTAIELAPNDARILETRGQIYASLKRWADAAADLERCLKGMDADGKRKVHATLARVYRELGDLELAEAHLERAKQGEPEKQESKEEEPKKEGAKKEE